jgi:Hint domain
MPETVWPVRVRAAAFGKGMPRRDLWLSPDHAVFVDDVLIPVRHLINGITIAQVPVDDV